MGPDRGAIIRLFESEFSDGGPSADGVRKLMANVSANFPKGLDYVIALDTTQPVTAGINEMIKTLAEALGLVILDFAGE